MTLHNSNEGGPKVIRSHESIFYTVKLIVVICVHIGSRYYINSYISSKYLN